MKEVLLESAAFSNQARKGFDRKPLLKEHESVLRASCLIFFCFFSFFFFFQAGLKELIRSFPALHGQAKFQIGL